VPAYRNLYIERAAAGHPNGQALLERHGSRPVVWIDSYSEVFYRAGQDFQEQKRAPALVAALADGPLLYEAPTRVCGVHDMPVFYNDQLRNCVYNCDYCFLQGMHPSGHTLVFVNSEAFHEAAARRAKDGPFWLSISYLTDILAFEPVLPIVSEWVAFARRTPEVTVEIRTKGEAPDFVRGDPVANVVLIWSLSPPAVAGRYERGCASFENRVLAARTAAERGWRVRIAVDPVILHPGWATNYAEMLSALSARVEPESVEAATYGVFRVGADFMGRMSAARADSPILHHPFDRADRVSTYSAREIDAIHQAVGGPLREWLGPQKLTFVHG